MTAPQKLQIDRVMPGEDGAFEQWYSMLTEIFTDPADLESKEDLRERLDQTDKNIFLLFRNEKGEPIGFELDQRDPSMPDAPVAYVPWTGMTADYRNHGMHPAIQEKVMDALRDMGVACLIHEVEDPKRIHVAYDERPGGENSQIAKRRANNWRREPNNSLIVDDGTSGDPESLTAYKRPASDDDQNIQAYDLMALRELDPTHKMFGKAFGTNPMLGIYNADKTAISIPAYKRLYLQMTQIQYETGMPEGLDKYEYYRQLEQKLRSDYPAVEDFCSRVDRAFRQNGPWMKLETDAIAPKSKPDPDYTVVLGKNLQSEQAPIIGLPAPLGLPSVQPRAAM